MVFERTVGDLVAKVLLCWTTVLLWVRLAQPRGGVHQVLAWGCRCVAGVGWLVLTPLNMSRRLEKPGCSTALAAFAAFGVTHTVGLLRGSHLIVWVHRLATVDGAYIHI